MRMSIDRKPLAGFDGGDAEKPNFGRGVESQAEEQADRIHLPTAVDQLEKRPEKASDEAAPIEHLVDASLVVGFAAARAAKRANDIDQHDQVDRRDQQKKVAETLVPTSSPARCSAGSWPLTIEAATAIPTVSAITTVE